jgi:hypothetical protein
MATSQSNTLAADTVLIKLGDIETARINWENGSYKRSNEDLYAVLNSCLVLFQEIKLMNKGKRKVIKEIDAILSSRGITVQKNTSLVTKIVRYVFGDCGKRAFTYARVILVADAEKKESESLQAFISGRHGIEEINKTANGKPSAKDTRDALVEEAFRRLENATPLISGITLIDELQPENEMMAVLMRKEPDGTGSIVYRSTNETIINTLLAASERDAKAKKKDADDAAAPGEAAEERADAIEEAAA